MKFPASLLAQSKTESLCSQPPCFYNALDTLTKISHRSQVLSPHTPPIYHLPLEGGGGGSPQLIWGQYPEGNTVWSGRGQGKFTYKQGRGKFWGGGRGGRREESGRKSRSWKERRVSFVDFWNLPSPSDNFLPVDILKHQKRKIEKGEIGQFSHSCYFCQAKNYLFRKLCNGEQFVNNFKKLNRIRIWIWIWM